MIQRLQARRGEEGGFTLIELLIVIIILGILAAIVVFAVGGITDRGVVASCKADTKAVEVAQEASYAQTGAYAASVDALKTANFLKDIPETAHYVITTVNTPAATAGHVFVAKAPAPGTGAIDVNATGNSVSVACTTNAA
jgi:general secretion pathway protein G